MIDFVREHRLGMVALGVVLAGAIAGAATVGGAPPSYGILVGLGIATPPMNLGRSGESFDRERYLQSDNGRAVLVDASVSGAVAILVGAGVVVAARALGVRSEGILVALSAAGTVLAGNVSFVYRTMEYRSLGTDGDGDGTEERDDVDPG